jgi:hypothetical protein
MIWRSKRWLHVILCLSLAIGAGQGVRHLWQPVPLGVYPEQEDTSDSVTIDTASRDGRWLLVNHRSKTTNDPHRWTVVDRTTGKAVRPLTNGYLGNTNHGHFHSRQHAVLSQDCLWWMERRMDGDHILLQLKCLPVRAEQPATVVHEWRFSSALRGTIHWVDTTSLHVVFRFNTYLEHALHSLAALTQDGMTLLPYYKTVWSSSQYQECWKVTGSERGFRCERTSNTIRGDVGEVVQHHVADNEGVLYRLADCLRADNLLSSEPSREFPVATHRFPVGWLQLCGNMLLVRRYFSFPAADGSISHEFDPRGFVTHPNATYEQYRQLFDKNTGQVVHMPPGMDRQWLISDELITARDRPAEFLLASASGPETSPFDAPRQFVWLSRQGNQLVRQSGWELDQAMHGMALSNDASQVYINRLRNRRNLFPMLHRWAETIPWLGSALEVLPEFRGGLEVRSPQTGQLQWTIPNAYLCLQLHESYEDAPGTMVLLRCKVPDQYPLVGHGLECWRTPMTIYSAWWYYGTGVLVLVLYVLVIRRGRDKEPKGSPLGVGDRCVTETTVPASA